MELPILHIPGYLDKTDDFADKAMIGPTGAENQLIIKLHFGKMFPGKLKKFQTMLTYLFGVECRGLLLRSVHSVPIVHAIKEKNYSIFEWLKTELDKEIEKLNIGPIRRHVNTYVLSTMTHDYTTQNGGEMEIILNEVDLSKIEQHTEDIKAAVSRVLVHLLMKYEAIQCLQEPIMYYACEIENEYNGQTGFNFQLSVFADKYETIENIANGQFDSEAISKFYEEVKNLTEKRNENYEKAKNRSDMNRDIYYTGIDIFKSTISQFLKVDHKFFFSREGDTHVSIMNTVVHGQELPLHGVPGTGMITEERLKEVEEKCKEKDMLEEYKELVLRLS